MSDRIDIGARMRELVAKARDEGINGIRFSDIAPECEDAWSEDYAIVQEAYSPDLFGCNEEYFDHDRLTADFKLFFIEGFADDPSVRVMFWNLDHGSNEIEVTRR